MNAKKILKTVLITIVIFLITLIITLIPLLIWVAKQPAATEETVTEQMVETAKSFSFSNWWETEAFLFNNTIISFSYLLPSQIL